MVIQAAINGQTEVRLSGKALLLTMTYVPASGSLCNFTDAEPSSLSAQLF
jgi:hypothetical protein